MDKRAMSETTTIVHTVKPISKSRAVASSQIALDEKLQQQIMLAIDQFQDLSDVSQRIFQLVSDALAPTMIEHLSRDPAQLLQVPHAEEILQRLPAGAANSIFSWANTCCDSGFPTVHRLSGAHAWTVIVVPVVFFDRAPEVLYAVFRQRSDDVTRVTSTLQLGSIGLALAHVVADQKFARAEAANLSALLELLAAIDNSANPTAGYQFLVGDLRKHLGCRQIALGLTRKGQIDCRLAAVSGISGFDQRSEFTNKIEAALNESTLRNEMTVVSVAQQSNSEGSRAHRNLLHSSQATTVITAPLTAEDGTIVGAWAFLEDRDETGSNETIQFARASGAIVGARLDTLRRSQPHFLLRPLNALLAAAGSRKALIGFLVCLLVFAAMVLPMNYKVRCDCQLEPVSRRFVAAPYDGTLKEARVEAGAVVHQGQLLAIMEPRELRWELSGLQADYASEQKKRDAAAAVEEFAVAQQSQLEMERLGLKMQLIEHRLDNLEIKSPIDGMVIAGDLKKSEGAPISIGQAMFEIGPLDRMIVEIAIPEREIRYVADGMQVDVRLEAARRDIVSGTIVRVSPRSETRDNESVYIAEVNLDNEDGTLRPGMKGSAKVVSDPHPLGWNLFHHAWESLAMMIGV